MGQLTIKPVISLTGLTCVTTIGSPVVTSAALFGSVTVGMPVIGAGIPFNSVVDIVTSTSSITLKDSQTGEQAVARATSGGTTLQFGYFTAAAYADGDTLGIPMRVPFRILRNIVVVDSAKQIKKLRLYFFSKMFTQIADNAAWAPSAADMVNLIGQIVID